MVVFSSRMGVGRSDGSARGARAARIAYLVRSLEQVLGESQRLLAAGDSTGAEIHLTALRRLRDQAAELLAELERLAPPERQRTSPTS